MVQSCPVKIRERDRMPGKSDRGNPYIDEVAGHRRRYAKLVELTHSSTKAAGIMLVAAIVAVAIANSSAYDGFLEFWHADVVVGFGGSLHSMQLSHIINDVFMAVFFLLVGLEVKYEMTVGALADFRKALLPILAACGGVLAPIGIFAAFNAGTASASGWGVPTATDIAFALGILALLGDRVPGGLRVFLSTLAVADDIIAVLVIAVFYGQPPQVPWLAAAAVVMVVLIALNRGHVYSLVPYAVVGVLLWYCVFMSGIHSTIAGVLLAFAIPSRSRVNVQGFTQWSGDQVRRVGAVLQPDQPVAAQGDFLEAVSKLSIVAKQAVPPAVRLEKRLYPWVYFLILPLFALANADVPLTGGSFGAIIADPVFCGVLLGLLLGKPIGIMAFSLVAVKSKAADLPEGVSWVQMLGVSILGGVGFTMAIFVSDLAFDDAAMINAAKMGILSASLLAGIIGFAFLLFEARFSTEDRSSRSSSE